MHIAGHALSALPFVALGQWEVAVGCILPDLAWVPREVQYRRSGVRPWATWSRTLTEGDLLWYRCTHSVLLWVAVSFVSLPLAVGALVHILLDLPTHGGLLTQRPLFPFTWRWPWPRKQ